MDISVALQAPFHYRAVWIIIACLVILLAVGLQIFFRMHFRGRLRRDKVPAQPSRESVIKARQKALSRMDRLEADLHGGKITIRRAYQKMSRITRHFVSRATGIHVEDYTLSEIYAFPDRQLSSKLGPLVEEFYEPEFARMSQADVDESIRKTRRLIALW